MAEHHHHHHHNHEHEHGPNCSHEEEHHHHHHDHHHEHEHEHGPNCNHDEEEEHDHHHEHEHHCCDHDHDDAEYFDYDDDDVEYEFEEGYLKQLRDQLPPEIKQLTLEEQDAYIQKSFKDFYKRRREQALMMQQHAQYKKEVSENYKHKHPDLLTLKPSFFNPTFWSALQDKSSLRSLLKEEYPHLYTFDMLTPEYCSKLLEEIENFESWCKNTEISIFRPNSMNNYGAILDDFGFYPIFQEWSKKLVAPIAEVLFPEFLGNGFDDHHAFVVEYKMGKDEKLDFHVDDSEVTINVCLGKQFTGGGLFFRGVRCAQHQQDEATKDEEYEFQHTPGKACVHVGRHRHGAHKITSGERFNLILWCRSSSFRHSNLFHGHFPLCGHKQNE